MQSFQKTTMVLFRGKWLPLTQFKNDDTGYVYRFTNTVNGKRYVGQSWQFFRRVTDHVMGRGCAKLLCRALKKHGTDNFVIEILYQCQLQDTLDKAEVLLIAVNGSLAPAGYNLASGGARGKHSAATKALIGALHKGKLVSEETREKLRQRNLGKTISDEAKTKASASLRDMYRMKDPGIYIFDCLSHKQMYHYATKNEAVDALKLSCDVLQRSLNNRHGKFLLNNRQCYARTAATPEDGLFFNFGRRVVITDDDGARTFPNLVIARTELNVKRGAIEYSIQRGKIGKYLNPSGKTMSFTAKYA